jgi:arginase
VAGLRYPARGGPATAQLAEYIGAILATGRVAAVGVACTWHAGHIQAAPVRQLMEGVLNR